MEPTAPFDVTFKDDVGDRRVSANRERQSLRQALVKPADEYDPEYAVPSHGHLVVWKRSFERECSGRSPSSSGAAGPPAAIAIVQPPDNENRPGIERRGGREPRAAG